MGLVTPDFEIKERQRCDKKTCNNADRGREPPSDERNATDIDTHELRGTPIHTGGAHRDSCSRVFNVT